MGTADELAREWVSRLGASKDRLAASSRYTGRGHRHATAAARRHGASHLIMSAGLGFVRPTDEIPGYRLTIKKGEADSILPRLAAPAGAAEWWEAIERHSTWARRLDDAWDGSSLILIALPVDYLWILTQSLNVLSATARARLRVISGARPRALPDSLRTYQLPYDARFNGPDSKDRGIGSDFLGRAAAHFLGLLEASSDGDIQHHNKLVEDALKSMRPAKRYQGRSLSDHEIATVIRFELASATRGSSKLLRRFRDELGIACEQGRFRRLYANVIRESVAA